MWIISLPDQLPTSGSFNILVLSAWSQPVDGVTRIWILLWLFTTGSFTHFLLDRRCMIFRTLFPNIFRFSGKRRKDGHLEIVWRHIIAFVQWWPYQHHLMIHQYPSHRMILGLDELHQIENTNVVAGSVPCRRISFNFSIVIILHFRDHSRTDKGLIVKLRIDSIMS